MTLTKHGGGFWLRTDSEYLPVFNHYLLKAFETGILHRLDKMIWNVDLKPPIKIEMTEPEPLGINNVMFLFSFLGVGIIISLAMATLENLVRKLRPKTVKKNQVRTSIQKSVKNTY